jgi:hypothetical protein
MKRSAYKAVYAIGAAAIVAVGVLRDPDIANADEMETPLTQDRLPGYQCSPGVPKDEPLAAADLARLNAPMVEPVPTF